MAADAVTDRAVAAFAPALIAWQQRHGRHDLPWQNTRDPYAVWLSEIMLQQTQVATVMPYYQRFLERFPTVAALAAAAEDDVLALWSGLGYYSRGRNLHRAAGIIVAEHGGRFPATPEALMALPGIGRSTAAAIYVFAFGGRAAILDGNVKRVLARLRGIEGYPGETAVAARLWRDAEALLPEKKIVAYTQGLMDLGATVCTRCRPRCSECPARVLCVALASDRVSELPTPKPRKALPQRRTMMLVLQRAGEILLEKRPTTGIWGGLWCFPEEDADADPVAACARRFGAKVVPGEMLPMIAHGFTHFRLDILPQPAIVKSWPQRAEEAGCLWISPEDALQAALPAPVRGIVERLLACGKTA
ncbi:MAG: A/G-specific adenine glycosylase [Burkholderiales bacterium]|nr:A/G-specific adenine glycosylase [Burkholderiales bacterium]